MCTYLHNAKRHCSSMANVLQQMSTEVQLCSDRPADDTYASFMRLKTSEPVSHLSTIQNIGTSTQHTPQFQFQSRRRAGITVASTTVSLFPSMTNNLQPASLCSTNTQSSLQQHAHSEDQ